MIHSIELIDFLAHHDTKLDFSNDATVFVGQNGAGKSSIIDAITFSLFGAHTRKNNKSLIRRGANKSLVKVDFSANGKNYRTVRQIDAKGTLTAQFLEKNGEDFIPIAEGERKQFGESMTEEVEKVLGINFEKLKIASIVQQGELNSIIKAKPKEFKELLNTIIGIDRLDVAVESMKEVLKEFRKDIQTKHGFDDTQIELLENRMNEFQNEITNSKPMMKKLEEEKQVRETKIIQIEQEVEKDSVKEIQLRELEDQKEELLSYAKETIKKIQREVMEEERKVNECKGCFSIVSKRGEIESRLFKLEEELQTISKELVESEKKKIRFEEQGEFANRLELKDGKCPVCDSKVDHLNPLFQKEHLEEEIKTLDRKISQTKEKQVELEDSIEKINDELREAENADIKLKTHNISTETELEQIAATIKEKVKKIKDIPITINSGQLLEASSIDAHAKMKYEKILQIEKTTSGFNQEEFLLKKKDLIQNRDRLRQIDQEFGAISNRIENAEQQLERNRIILDELHNVRKYVIELENIQKNVYSIDGPVAKSLRSWALDIISEKASEYLEKLNTKIQRISLSQKTRDVNITCYARSTMLELESLSGGEQVSIALSLRLGMAHLLGASNLNFMILDEPTTHLDSERRKALVGVLSQLASIRGEEASMQFIIISHDAEIFEDSSVENIYNFESAINGTLVNPL
ncbi:MAG: putative DNA double-strand break repair Rad50 ATPase [Candidatus Nitrosopelagicus brevis]|jgi:exonuclease SbcC|nr:MAG: putative DNA double-strand break repair Rad50 ATPase [Candidatus Nitrosopelagicus brevis]